MQSLVFAHARLNPGFDTCLFFGQVFFFLILSYFFGFDKLVWNADSAL